VFVAFHFSDNGATTDIILFARCIIAMLPLLNKKRADTIYYYCSPLALTSMHSYCLLNICALCKFCCPFPQCVTSLIN